MEQSHTMAWPTNEGVMIFPVIFPDDINMHFKRYFPYNIVYFQP